MSEKITLRGIAWDHPRGYEPLKSTSLEFSSVHPDVRIDWDIRSLKEFGDKPLEDLINTYDLITIDHPYVGQAHANQLLVSLEEHLPEDAIEKLRLQSVGPTFESYFYDSHLYALPIDAAGLVAAYREDLVLSMGVLLPKTRTELFDFYRKVPGNVFISWPLCPTDLWCSFLTMCAQDADHDFIVGHVIKEQVGAKVLDELKKHLEFLQPESIYWNPIQVLNHMSENEDIVYSPFLFGYTNYGRQGYAKHRIRFDNSPSNPKTKVSTILGGIGLAVSSRCQHVDAAVSYIYYVARAETQEGIYTQNGGQPGNMIAWQSETNNALCNNFFNDTMETMQNVYVRPRHPGWNEFQERGAELLHKGLVENIPSNILMKDLNQLYQSIAVYEEQV